MRRNKKRFIIPHTSCYKEKETHQKIRGKEGREMKMAHWEAKAKKIAPYAYMILAQIIAASYAILSKIVFTQGTNTIVFNIYQFTAATIFMGPLAFFIERCLSNFHPTFSFSVL